MLAYVFWHAPLPDAHGEEYERHLAAFHDALATDGPRGFVASTVFRLERVPWLSSDRTIYEDWYLLEDSAAIDRLNQAAVTAHRLLAHDRVARLADSGTAGLYRLRNGTLEPHHADTAVWLSKPRAQSYDQFYRILQATMPADRSALWGRQMVLGPTPEFCLHLAEAQPEAGIEGLVLPVHRVWPVR